MRLILDYLYRNVLFESYVRLVDKLNPKCFVFENVKGIKTMFKGRYLEMVANSFSKIGFDIYFKILNSKDYGVPQNRPRILIIGVRNDISKSLRDEDDAILSGHFPFPTSDYPNIEDIFSDLIDNNFEYGGNTETYKYEPKNQWQENCYQN